MAKIHHIDGPNETSENVDVFLSVGNLDRDSAANLVVQLNNVIRLFGDYTVSVSPSWKREEGDCCGC